MVASVTGYRQSQAAPPAPSPRKWLVRAAMLEILETDYIKAAWAMGLPRRVVIYGDALGNAIVPVVTALGVVFGFLMAGNPVVEDPMESG